MWHFLFPSGSKPDAPDEMFADQYAALTGAGFVLRTRRRWSGLFADYGARMEVSYLEPTLAVLHERNGRRRNRTPHR